MNFVTTWYEQLRPKLSDLSLLILRVWVGQEFLVSGYTKLSGGFTPPEWFVQLDFPFPHGVLGPTLNWGIAGVSEIGFGSALILGLGARIAALALMYITYIAIYTVHFDLGWAGWNLIEADAGNGFKVPLMIAVMLLTLLGQGAGNWSIDAVLCRNHDNKDKT